MTPIIEGMVTPEKPKPPAWSAEDATRARTGHYNAHDGKGWQRCDGSLPATHTDARDRAAREEQAAHRASVIKRIHEAGSALVQYAQAHGG